MDVNLHQSPPTPSKPSRSSVASRLPLIVALRRPHLVRLWLSQVLSSIGDQLYTIAVIWIAIRLAGGQGGLVVAAESAAALAFGLLAGVYVDRWDRQVTMISVDALRALAVLSLPVLSVLGGLRFWELVVVAVVLGGLGTLFDPALQASLPSLAEDSQTLNAANALMDITRRLARILGPGLAGVLVAILPLAHFFTLDAVSFALSALAVLSLGRRFAWKPPHLNVASSGRAGVWQEMREAIGLIYRHRLLWYTLLTLGIVTLAWSMALTLGAALLAARVLHGGVGAYGLIVGAYGVGNVASNIVIGSLHIRRQPLLIFGGKLILGAGFFLLALSPNLPFALITAAIAAVGGPMSDLPLQRLVQLEIPPAQLGKVFSLRNLIGEGGFMLGLLLAPVLFATLPVRTTIVLAAAVTAGAGFIGLFRFGWLGEAI
jgi:MFS family permease